MPPLIRCWFALSTAWLTLVCAGAALAQGVYSPVPGSAPTATGPGSANPSAAASAINPSAHNPSAAPSAVTTLNALNPSATSSTFAPVGLSRPNPSGVLIGPVSPLNRVVRIPRRSRKAVRAPRSRAQAIHRRGRTPPRAFRGPLPEAAPWADRNPRAIMGSVCRDVDQLVASSPQVRSTVFQTSGISTPKNT